MNRLRITLISFLAYFVMSGMLSPIGIITGPMAEAFGQPITVVTALFSWLTFGILAGSILALVVFDLVAIKHLFLGLYTVIGACLVSVSLTDSLDAIGPILSVVGACCGIGLAGAATMISTVYEAEQRASMLVITDGSFSVAGIVCSSVALFLLARDFPWFGAYQFVAAVAGIILLLAFVSKFPTPAAATTVEGQQMTSGRWPLSVWLCIAALFLYTLGQQSLLWWLPTDIETRLGVPAAQAGEVVSRFWTGMLFAQLFVAWWVLKIGIRRLVILGAITTSACSVPMWLLGDIDWLLILALVWGFANLGLLKIIISFATLMVATPTPRLVSGLLLGATLGTAVSPSITSLIVSFADTHVVLQFGTACYVSLTVLVLIASRLLGRADVDRALQLSAANANVLR